MKSRDGFYGWTVVFALSLIMGLNVSFPLYGAGVIGAYMAQDLQLDGGTLGLAFSVNSLFMGLPGPLVGYFVSRWGVRSATALGTLTLLLGALGMALWAESALRFVLGFGVVMGVGAAFGGLIAAQSGVAFWFRRRAASAMAIVLIGSSVGGFLAPSLIEWVISSNGGNWRLGWLTIAGFGGLSFLVALVFVRNRPADLGQVPDGPAASVDRQASDPRRVGHVYRTDHAWTFREAVGTRQLWFILFCALAFAGGIVLLISHGVVHLRSIGFSPATAAMALGLLPAFTLGGGMLVAVFGNRIDPRFIWSAGMLVYAAGAGLSVHPVSLAEIYLFVSLVGLGVGTSAPCMTVIIRNYYGAGAFASLLGILTPAMTIGTALAPALAGMAYARYGSYEAALYCAAGFGLAASILLLLTTPPALRATAFDGQV